MYTKYVNVKNDFYKDSLDALCEELEKGETVHIGVSCIGHTRQEWVEAKYVDELRKKYGDRLQDDGAVWMTGYYLA